MFPLSVVASHRAVVTNAPQKLPAHVLREVAVAADTDPRTVAKYVSGETVKALCAKRIDRALRARGLAREESATQPESGITHDRLRHRRDR